VKGRLVNHFAATLIPVVLLAMTMLAELAPTPAQQLRSLFEEDWQWRLRDAPERATMLGDHRFDDKLTDLSPEAIEARKQHARDMLRRLEAIDRGKLSGQDGLSYDLFQFEQQQAVDAARFPLEVVLLDQLDGPQLALGQLMAFTRFETADDYRNYIARLKTWPRYLDQVIALLKRGIELRWVQPKGPLASVPAQIDGQLVKDVTASPLYEPFKHFPATIPEAERQALAKAGEAAIQQAAFPALAKFRDFVQSTYLPAGERPIGALTLPDGKDYYAFAVRRATTTNLTAQQVHDIGLSEVARIRKEMEAVVVRSGFKGSFAEFLTFLRTDARFYYTKAEDLLTGYRDIAKRSDAELPKLFAELPRNTYGVRAFPDYEAPSQTTARYYPGAADATRPGYFMVNTYRLAARPKYEMEALTLHEAVPGHHLQISRAQELKGLPEFRRNAEYVAYVEGWALYCESLGGEMGFYQDPYSKFGQLTYEMWRACRLVVDTGIHALGWSRQKAIDYMKENTAKSEQDIAVEVDRYIVWPGQAQAYKVGELKIKELRAKAEKRLGKAFDLRRFHNALLDNGPLPLDLLEQELGRWISAEGKRR
jgi:uncharacterized protein (DUF885 family)